MTRSEHPTCVGYSTSMFDFEERELKELDLKNPILRSGWRSSRRPRSPSSNHNVKELPSGMNFQPTREASPPASSALTCGEEGVYRGAASACQTVNRQIFIFFARAMPQPRRASRAPLHTSIPMGEWLKIRLWLGGQAPASQRRLPRLRTEISGREGRALRAPSREITAL